MTAVEFREQASAVSFVNNSAASIINMYIIFFVFMASPPAAGLEGLQTFERTLGGGLVAFAVFYLLEDFHRLLYYELASALFTLRICLIFCCLLELENFLSRYIKIKTSLILANMTHVLHYFYSHFLNPKALKYTIPPMISSRALRILKAIKPGI